MKNMLKSWKTTFIGIIAILGLIYNGYINGGFDVRDFLMLIFGVGFMMAKDVNKTHSRNRKKYVSDFVNSQRSNAEEQSEDENEGGGAVTPDEGF